MGLFVYEEGDLTVGGEIILRKHNFIINLQNIPLSLALSSQDP